MIVILKRNRIWLYLLLAIMVCMGFALPAASQEMLQTTLTRMQESQAWWDQLWKDTFEPTNLSNNLSTYTFATAVRTILAIGLIFWLFQYGQKMVETKGLPQHITTTTQFIIPIVIAVIFLSNQAFYSRLMAYGMRDIVNSWTNGVMEMQISGQQIRSALTDQLVTQDIKDQLTKQGQKCMQMPQPAVALPSATRPPLDPNNPLTSQQEQAYEYLECIQKLGTLAEQQKQEALNNRCSSISPLQSGVCSFSVKYLERTINSISQILEEETMKVTKLQAPNYTRGLGDLIGGGIATAGYSSILKVTQSLWTSFLELAMWLMALFAPIFIAASIIPGRQNLFSSWLIGFLTIGLAKLAYVIVIAVVAVQQASQQTILATDLTFPMALGLFAPGVSFAVVTGGGIAAAMSFRGQSVAVVGAAASAMTGAVASIGYSMTRYADRRR